MEYAIMPDKKKRELPDFLKKRFAKYAGDDEEDDDKKKKAKKVAKRAVDKKKSKK